MKNSITPAGKDWMHPAVQVARRTLYEWDNYIDTLEENEAEPSDFFHTAFVLSNPSYVKEDDHESDLVHGKPTTRYLLTVRAIKAYLDRSSIEDLLETIDNLDGKVSSNLLEFKMIVHDVINERMRLDEVGKKGLERLPRYSSSVATYLEVPSNLRESNKKLISGVIELD